MAKIPGKTMEKKPAGAPMTPETTALKTAQTSQMPEEVPTDSIESGFGLFHQSQSYKKAQREEALQK